MPPKPQGKPFTPKEELFIREYLIDFNGRQAAIRSGYTPKHANVTGSQLLAKSNIRAAINEKIREILQDKDELALKVKRELEILAFSDIGDHVEYDSDGLRVFPSKDTDTRAIQSVEIKEDVLKRDDESAKVGIRSTKIKLHDKRAALETLAKYTELLARDTGGIAEIHIHLDDQDAKL